MAEIYKFGSSQNPNYEQPTSGDWKAAFDRAPACHHPNSIGEVIPTGELPDIAINLAAKLEMESIEKEIDALFSTEE